MDFPFCWSTWKRSRHEGQKGKHLFTRHIWWRISNCLAFIQNWPWISMYPLWVGNVEIVNELDKQSTFQITLIAFRPFCRLDFKRINGKRLKIDPQRSSLRRLTITAVLLRMPMNLNLLSMIAPKKSSPLWRQEDRIFFCKFFIDSRYFARYYQRLICIGWVQTVPGFFYINLIF